MPAKQISGFWLEGPSSTVLGVLKTSLPCDLLLLLATVVCMANPQDARQSGGFLKGFSKRASSLTKAVSQGISIAAQVRLPARLPWSLAEIPGWYHGANRQVASAWNSSNRTWGLEHRRSTGLTTHGDRSTPCSHKASPASQTVSTQWQSHLAKC